VRGLCTAHSSNCGRFEPDIIERRPCQIIDQSSQKTMKQAWSLNCRRLWRARSIHAFLGEMHSGVSRTWSYGCHSVAKNRLISMAPQSETMSGFLDNTLCPFLVPLRLVNETLLHRPIFQGLYKVSVSATRFPAPSPPSIGSCIRINIPIRRGRVVCWAGLQSYRCIRVKVTCHSLNGLGYPALLLLHRRGPLATRSCCGLRIEILLRSVLCPSHLARTLLHHTHLMTVARWLGRIWWRRCLLMRSVHVVVHRWRLSNSTWAVLAHLHIRSVCIVRCRLMSLYLRRLHLSLSLGLCLSGLSSLLTDKLSFLLLPYARGRGFGR